MKEIIAGNKSLVRAIIRKITGSYNEDLEQEVYIKTWRNLDKYKEEGKFRQWLGTLTANVCRDYFKSKRYIQSRVETSDEEILETPCVSSSPEEIIDSKNRQKIILNAVNHLPAKMKKVVVLAEFEGWSQEQIATKLGIPVGTVKSRLFNANKLLSEQLSFLIKGE